MINFAHGGFLAIGAYLAFTLIPYIGFWGALLLAPILTAFFGLIVERFLIRRSMARDPLYSLLLTFGLAFMFEDGTRFIWGAQSLPFQVPGWLTVAASARLFLPDRLSAVHGVRRRDAVAGLFHPQLHPARHAHPRRHARSRHRLGARRQRSRLAQPEFRPRHLSGGPRRRPRRRHARPAADHRLVLIMPSFVAIIVGGLGSLPGTLFGGLLIGVASGSPPSSSLGHRGRDLRHDGRSCCWCVRAACSARRGVFD